MPGILPSIHAAYDTVVVYCEENLVFEKFTFFSLVEIICGNNKFDSKIELSPLSDTFHINTTY